MNLSVITLRSAQASILVGVLWCLALLSVIVIGVLHTARMDLQVVKNYGDRIQAHYLALAGVEKAKALLFQDAVDRRQAGKNHTGALYDAPEDFRDVTLGRGQFRVLRHGTEEEGGGIIFGVRDEESRLNINYAGPEELSKLPGIGPETIAAIIDWRDPDNNLTPGGAEAEYYSSLLPPYVPRNGQLLTVRELLMVRGVSSDLLFGDDADQNGFLDSENDAAITRKHAGPLDGGWSEIITVDSWTRNVNAGGDTRVNIQTADEGSLASIKGFSSDIAKAIVAGRGKKQLESLADLLDVTPAQNQGQGRGASPGSDSASSGPKLISEKLLMDVADDLTVQGEREQAGPININSASVAVLSCLPGISSDLAQAMVTYRTANGPFPNIAWLLKVPGFSKDLFKQVAARISARSETFRIISEGKVNSTGARQRLQVIVHIGASDIDTVSYREDL
jgi:competence ComEA-like helix-hairpin-helix protein